MRCSSCETGYCSRKSSLPDQRWRHKICFLKKNSELVMRNSKWLKISPKRFFPFLRPATLHFRKAWWRIWVMNSRGLTASSSRSVCAVHRGLVLRFLLWKFSSAIYKGRFWNCSAGLNISLHGGKKRKEKKSGMETEKNRLANCEAAQGKKGTYKNEKMEVY